MQISPHEVARRVVLALVLEPIAEKKDCTTRSRDMRKDLRLVDLQGAGVNVGKYFYELTERMGREKGQPKLYYDLCFEALRNSTRNLSNKKIINLGLLELLFMIVVSQLAYGGNGERVLKNLKKVLLNSSPRDVHYKEKALELAWSSSRKEKKKSFPKRLGGKNLFEHYQAHFEQGKRQDFTTHAFWCDQVLRSLPIVQRMYEVAKKALHRKLVGALEEAYREGFKRFAKPGIIADYTAVVAYLLLSEQSSDKIV